MSVLVSVMNTFYGSGRQAERQGYFFVIYFIKINVIHTYLQQPLVLEVPPQVHVDVLHARVDLVGLCVCMCACVCVCRSADWLVGVGIG